MGSEYRVKEMDGDHVMVIEDVILPEALDAFKSKAADYSGAFFLLGVKGQFSDINRKFWKLKRALWDDESLTHEQPEEILEDIIGHCLLTIYLLRKEAEDEMG